MRNLSKREKPQRLAENEVEWLAQFKADRKNNTKRYRYRHADIKSALKSETADKCIYCESKIGHNTPGDVEHKVPSSKVVDLHFDWGNLTIACTECNRRKNDYYEQHDGFLDPYADDVEAMLEHLGPIVHWNPGDNRTEVTVKILALSKAERSELITRKIDKLEEVASLLERHAAAQGPLKAVLREQLLEMAQLASEFSAMVSTALKTKQFL